MDIKVPQGALGALIAVVILIVDIILWVLGHPLGGSTESAVAFGGLALARLT